jgi:putative transposase
MPWRNMIEERLKFVLEAIDTKRKLTFSDLCQIYNISTKTGYKWVNRYSEKGKEGLRDESRAPKNHPTKISGDAKQCVIWIRQEQSTWGPKKIHAEILKNFKNVSPPSEASIGNILKEHDLSEPQFKRRHVAKTAPLKECMAPNDTWMYDFKGWFLTKNGSKCEPLTITDGFSRYLIECKHMNRKRGVDVWGVLERAFLEFGLPNKMRSDNGPPFASLGIGRLSQLSIKLIKIGVIPEWIEPGCPQQNGRHERFHLTLKNETALPPALTLPLQEEKFNQFKDYYNNIRPHEALGQETPSFVYTPSPRTWDRKFRAPEYSDGQEVRKVGRCGSISWKNSTFFLSEMLEGEYVGIKMAEVGAMEIHYGPILLGIIDLNKGFKKA